MNFQTESMDLFESKQTETGDVIRLCWVRGMGM